MFYVLIMNTGGKVKLNDLLGELSKAADVWDNIGIFLNVPIHIIQIIRKECNSALQSLTNMLTWLEENDKISWKQVVEALFKVQKRELARQICLKFCKWAMTFCFCVRILYFYIVYLDKYLL